MTKNIAEFHTRSPIGMPKRILITMEKLDNPTQQKFYLEIHDHTGMTEIVELSPLFLSRLNLIPDQ